MADGAGTPYCADEGYFSPQQLERIRQMDAWRRSWVCGAIVHGTVPSRCGMRNPDGTRRCAACGAERPEAS